MVIEKLLSERKVPELRTREEMLDILQSEVYGYLPPKPDRVWWESEEKYERRFYECFCGGKAHIEKITAHCELNGKEFSFPFHVCIPTSEGRHPFFVHVDFNDRVPGKFMPTMEIMDNDFAVLSFCYKDVTSDNSDFTNGLPDLFTDYGIRYKTSDPGKIAMWAWAAQRVMDYAETRSDVLDLDRSIVCGHSRLGKTALFAAATDERFKFAYANDSGCTGAAISRGKGGESVLKINMNFSYWFCANYMKYAAREYEMPFDQNYLLASIAPRCVLVGSASEDRWADPISEFLCCAAAGKAFKGGFVCEDRLPQPGDKFYEGDIGYHMRPGLHYFTRTDWNWAMEFVNMKQK